MFKRPSRFFRFCDEWYYMGQNRTARVVAPWLNRLLDALHGLAVALVKLLDLDQENWQG